MKRILSAALLLLLISAGAQSVFAQAAEPTTYVIGKGDTLWGLSERFLKDPHYWPNLWTRNQQQITNPHLIFPGQKLKIYPDRIVVEEAPVEKPGQGEVARETREPKAPEEIKAVAEETPQEKTFLVSGGEGFLLEKDLKPAGFIISTHQNRQIVGEDDIVYTDIGRVHGAKAGERFSIFKKAGAISHPLNNVILGYKVVPLGTLQLTEMEDSVSKAIITRSFMEVGVGAYLMPYRDRKRDVALQASDRELTGYIVETMTGNSIVGANDVVYLDLGRAQGLKVGNLLYVARDVVPDQKFLEVPVEKLPAEVLGALVVVDIGENTATALVVKSIDTIYRGDRVELKKSK
jgi:LysM repeat protein